MARREWRGAASRAQRAGRATSRAHAPAPAKASRAARGAASAGGCALAACGDGGEQRQQLRSRHGQAGGARGDQPRAARWKGKFRGTRTCTSQGVEGSKEGGVGGRLRAGGLRGWRSATAAIEESAWPGGRGEGRPAARSALDGQTPRHTHLHQKRRRGQQEGQRQRAAARWRPAGMAANNGSSDYTSASAKGPRAQAAGSGSLAAAGEMRVTTR
eukprot:jgi/Tetstr1/459536/TSEL_004901.t1